MPSFIFLTLNILLNKKVDEIQTRDLFVTLGSITMLRNNQNQNLNLMVEKLAYAIIKGPRVKQVSDLQIPSHSS